MNSLNAWDFGCLITLAICIASGYIGGFVWDTGRWIGAALGVYVANEIFTSTHLYHWQNASVWLCVMLATWGVFLSCASRLSRFVLKSPVALIDRSLGAVGGCIRGVVILVVAFSMSNKVFTTLPPEMRAAWCYKYLRRGSCLLEKHTAPIINYVRSSFSESNALPIEDEIVK
jgi:uncharacterized membrane protein required for colicin V production